MQNEALIVPNSRQRLRSKTARLLSPGMSDESEHIGNGKDALRISAATSPFRIDHAEALPVFETAAAKADFEFWCKMATWTIEEAVALAFEKDPEVVTWDSLKPDMEAPFVESYRRVRKLALRAMDAGRLADPSPPLEFIAWTNETGIPFSEEFAATVFQHAELTASRRRELERTKSGVVVQSEDGTVNPKSFNTLLRMLGGIIFVDYKFDPSEKRSDVPKTIQSDLDRIGVNLDLDTIRKWAKASVRAAEIL